MADEASAKGSQRSWILGEKFDKRMPHHNGIKALWETKWKFPCTISVYPFHDGKFQDFEPVFEYLIAVSLEIGARVSWKQGVSELTTGKNDINDGFGDAYTEAFFPIAEKLTAEGDECEDTAKASELYLRAACLYRIARFPYITNFPEVNSQSKWRAWQAQKDVYLKAGSKWDCPVRAVDVPHTERQGADRETIPVYVRLPKSAESGSKCPAVVLFTGLDGYRPDNTQRCEEFLSRGWGCVIVEVPGTAECPADPSDAAGPDRLWTALLDWMQKENSFDMQKVMVWGLSTGGYYAVRIAHTHRERLVGVIAQGAGTHYFFDADWIEKADGHEYPFALGPPIAQKHGYASFQEFKEGAQKKFSLLETGILEKPSTRLLLINGVDDGLMPIEDSMLLFEHGTPKEARFFAKALHMGYPMANAAVYPWMESVMASPV
ncbi:alpha hydrolase-14 [Coleophoma cylindrospora]|uniref:Alpha hydrolase-14 n=1 Tax=Coleophoma cylindrospora TaxID=1849047 RepID=A0A3D8S6J4_9HELO|nr:alpha hydrolase-14 [Coleophoma cylindrospora]